MELWFHVSGWIGVVDVGQTLLITLVMTMLLITWQNGSEHKISVICNLPRVLVKWVIDYIYILKHFESPMLDFWPRNS